MNATQTLLLAQLDSRREGFTAGELATLIEKGETTVRENLKKLVFDGEVVKDEKNFRRPNHITVNDETEIVDEAMDTTMREQMATPIPEDEVRPEHVEDEQSPEQADLEAALRASLEAQGVTPGETGSTVQPPAGEASEDDSTVVTVTEDGSTVVSTTEHEDEKPAKKKYTPRRENPDRPIRKNQKTGSELQVVPAGQVPDGFSTEDPTPPWYTLCHTHRASIGSKKIMSAWAYSTNPEKFCGGCKSALAEKA